METVRWKQRLVEVAKQGEVHQVQVARTPVVYRDRVVVPHGTVRERELKLGD